jgi:hypothetical protein
MHASPEDWDAIDHLGPICEAEGSDAAPNTKAAPLPKDAKPQSPYP